DDVATTLEFPRDRVVVAHPGIGAEFTAVGEASELGAPYLLTVATLEPRKNLGTLVEAHTLLEETGLLLAVVGGAGWGEQPQLDRPRIVRLGRVTDAELARLYRGAAAVVYPSRFEGFGMPITEAMASGAPVVASAHASMDEASGDAAVRVDPESPQSIADGVREALARRGELRSAGLEHVRRFSWRRTGEAFLQGYERWQLAHLDVAQVSFPATSRLASLAADTLWYPRLTTDADVLHCPTFRGPFRARVPLVVTVHDLAVLRHPEWFNRWTAAYSRFAVPRVVAAASRVVAVSEFTKRELVDLLGTAPAKIRVVPNAVEDVFTPEGPRAEGDYVLAVGTLEPRKNLE